MSSPEEYIDLKGKVLSLARLDPDEQGLVRGFMARAEGHPDWNEYRNFWMSTVWDFYSARGLTRRATQQTLPYLIGQDLCSRIGISAGYVRQSDYRDELEQLIRTRFSNRREFCEATGLAEDMLSHVLARRKHLAVDTLAEALARVGYTLHIVPMPRSVSHT
ncbi:MAG TPA: hypothetical protein VMV69_13840 [Pirellulales bacterium]|nr:hypothetical protein [Pirellulales bacterium]